MAKKVKEQVAYRVWTKDEILASFDKYDAKSFLRVIGVIYDRQTASEKMEKGTTESNGMGFGAYDAEFLTDVYEKGMRYGGLTPGQFAAAKKAMRKYAGQLALVKNEQARAAWEVSRQAEAEAENKAFESSPSLMAAYHKALETAPADALTINESGKPDVAYAEPEVFMCAGCGDDCMSPVCSRCLADEYEGPDAESIALSRAYSSAY